jgi:WhiB family redox-sensing transcriptional regulator
MTGSITWYDNGLCQQRNIPPKVFFPDMDNKRAINRAKMICRMCDVVKDCLSWAIKNHEEHGIWGGKTPPERKQIWFSDQLKVMRSDSLQHSMQHEQEHPTYASLSSLSYTLYPENHTLQVLSTQVAYETSSHSSYIEFEEIQSLSEQPYHHNQTPLPSRALVELGKIQLRLGQMILEDPEDLDLTHPSSLHSLLDVIFDLP